MKPMRIREETQHYTSTLRPHYQTQFSLFTMPDCPVAKADFLGFFCPDGKKNPKQINFPRAPHPGSRLPWISNVVACSEIKATTRRQGQIKDAQFKATSSSLRWSLVTLEIYIFHTCWTGIESHGLFFRLRFVGPEIDRGQTDSHSPSPLSRYLANSHSPAPLALEPK